METLRVHVFKHSFGPFIALLNEHRIKYVMQDVRSGILMNSSGLIEILNSAAMWGALATVIVAYLKNRRSRKVTITTKDDTVIHAEAIHRRAGKGDCARENLNGDRNGEE